MIWDMFVLLGYFAFVACGTCAGVIGAWMVLDRFSGGER